MMYLLKRFSETEITPAGWIKDQLFLQAKGLSGNVLRLWEDLSSSSAWLGGTKEAWERGPYFLDGLVPLSWLTKDPALLEEKHRWIEAILSGIQPDGNFGPKRNPDVWPRFVAMKALMQEYRNTKDERILKLLLGYCRFLNQTIEAFPPKFWAYARALEPLEPIIILCELTHEEWLLTLIDKLRIVSYDWVSFFLDFPYPKNTTHYLNRELFRFVKWIAGPIDSMAKNDLRIKQPEDAKKVKAFNQKKSIIRMMTTHGVNLAMAIKYPTVYGMIQKDPSLVSLGKLGYETLLSYHGLPIGIHSADEHLSGPEAFQGTELCAVVEEMYSFEQMLQATKDPYYADALDRLAFNALPATFTADMTKHQYVQQPNQIACDRKHRSFYDTNKEGNIYGFAPNYGCCLANMHQGFPKYTSGMIYSHENGISIMGYVPQLLKSELFGEPFSISIKGNYPFENQINIVIHECPDKPLILDLRIPENTEGTLSVGDEEPKIVTAGLISLNRTFKARDQIHLDLTPKFQTRNNADGSVSFWYGSILLALPLKPNIRTIRREEPFTDVEMTTQEQWNFAPVTKNDQLIIIRTERSKVAAVPFSTENPPLKIDVEGVEVLNWKESHHSAGRIPETPIQGKKTTITLVPYGSTDLRISAFPKIIG